MGETEATQGQTNGHTQSTSSGLPTPNITAKDPDEHEIHVSDIDSDLEIDELVPAYLRIKGRLYGIDPQLAEPVARKQPKGAKAKKALSSPMATNSAVRKLLSQLHQITSDALFDERDAEAQWPAKRNQIALDQAAKRQRPEAQPTQRQQPDENASEPSYSITLKSSSIPDAAEHLGSEDEVDLLGDMFSAIPDQIIPTRTEAKDAVPNNVMLRDFGKSTGLTPRRLLEEAVRSRSVNIFSFRSASANSV
jgi:ATP-dependent RNA helicase DHX29